MASGGFTHYGDVDSNASIKFSVAKERLDSQGYTSTGSYYGVGVPIYFVQSEDGVVFGVFRSFGRDDVKAEVRRRFPNAKFYR